MYQRPLATSIYRKVTDLAADLGLDGHTAIPRLYDLARSLVDERRAAEVKDDPPASAEI